jgi:hypothetical protein
LNSRLSKFLVSTMVILEYLSQISEKRMRRPILLIDSLQGRGHSCGIPPLIIAERLLVLLRNRMKALLSHHRLSSGEVEASSLMSTRPCAEDLAFLQPLFVAMFSLLEQ